jgi:hypothetical protein
MERALPRGVETFFVTGVEAPPSAGRGSPHAARATRRPAALAGDAVRPLPRVERRNDRILVRGATAYPSELEAPLGARPAVRPRAAIAVPDDQLGNSVHAVVAAVAPVTLETRHAHLAAHPAGKSRRSALSRGQLARGDRA